MSNGPKIDRIKGLQIVYRGLWQYFTGAKIAIPTEIKIGHLQVESKTAGSRH